MAAKNASDFMRCSFGIIFLITVIENSDYSVVKVFSTITMVGVVGKMVCVRVFFFFIVGLCQWAPRLVTGSSQSLL